MPIAQSGLVPPGQIEPILEAQAAPWEGLLDQLFDPKPDRLCTTHSGLSEAGRPY